MPRQQLDHAPKIATGFYNTLTTYPKIRPIATPGYKASNSQPVNNGQKLPQFRNVISSDVKLRQYLKNQKQMDIAQLMTYGRFMSLYEF